MKNKNFNILTVLIAVFMVAVFSACQNEPIFYNIAKEKPLDKGIVQGNIHSLVEQGENLYTQNGNIYRKKADGSSKWTDVKKPSGNVQRLASSDTYLYAINDSFEIYSAPASNGELSWTKIEGTSNAKTIFDNEATPGTGKRIAYYSSYDEKNGAKLFKLDGTKATEIAEYTKISTKTERSYPVKAAWITTGDKTVFSDNRSFTSNRNDKFYLAAEKSVKYSPDGATWTEVKPEISAPTALAFYNDGSKSWLYVGTKDGLQVLELDAGVPKTKVLKSVGSNADSCFDKTEIFGIFPYPQGGALYVSTTSGSETGSSILIGSKNNRLWGYHKDNDTWNRE